MVRLLLVHWNEREAREYEKLLGRRGNAVELCFEPNAGTAALRSLRENPPAVCVISLERLPSHGSGVATWWRQQAKLRHVPIVFAGGKPEKVQAVRGLLPDAVFTGWADIGVALSKALEKPPEKPVVPGTMQAYTGTPLPAKLGLKEGSRLALLGEPDGFEEKLAPRPPGLSIRRQARGNFDVVVLFVTSAADLSRRFDTAAKCVLPRGRLWIAWPKKAAGIATDVTQSDVRRFGLDREWVDFKIAAIDETWSGLSFVRRRPT